MSASDNTAPAEGAPAPAEPPAKKSDKLAAWSLVALLLGIAGDLVEPLGNVAIWLLAGGGLVMVLSFVLGGPLKFVRRIRLHSVIFCAIMAVVVTLQLTAPAKEKAAERGAAVTYLPFLGGIQTTLLSSRLSAAEQALYRFQDALAGSGSDAARAATARQLYTAEEDATVRRGMLEAMLDSGKPELQQAAILLRLAERDEDRLQLLPVNRDASDALSRRLLSYSFRIDNVDVDSGALRLFGEYRGTDGTVTLRGISMQLHIFVSEDDHRPMTVELAPGKDRMLTGTARLDSGEAVAVELPLF